MASSAIFKEELMKNSLFLQRCTAALHCLLALAGVCATGPVSACPESPGATCNAAAASPAGQSLGLSVNLGVDNPINVINGNKYQPEEDMPALPGVLGLEIVGHYNSFDDAAAISANGHNLRDIFKMDKNQMKNNHIIYDENSSKQ
jgi:hypothetical protein